MNLSYKIHIDFLIFSFTQDLYWIIQDFFFHGRKKYVIVELSAYAKLGHPSMKVVCAYMD